MIGYAPLDPVDEPARAPPVAPPQPRPAQQQGNVSECNYLVMFFIVGVLGLALKDMLRK